MMMVIMAALPAAGSLIGYNTIGNRGNCFDRNLGQNMRTHLLHCHDDGNHGCPVHARCHVNRHLTASAQRSLQQQQQQQQLEQQH
jgi:hypothetical protein